MIFENIALAAAGFANFKIILLLITGVVAGLIAGAIPGFTVAMAVVLVLPFTFSFTAVEGLATMIGVYVGGFSGGLMSGILTGIPGTPGSVATTFDGFPMARKRGLPGLALGVGVWASFFGGIIAAICLAMIAPQLARIGLEFQPWDYFALMMFAITMTASLAGDNLLKGLIAGMIGLLLATVGEDVVVGVPRFNFGIDAIGQGFSFLPVLIGLFAFSQLLADVRDPKTATRLLGSGSEEAVRIEHLKAARTVLKDWINLVRSSLIGVFVGVLPAEGASISNVLAYDQAKKSSKNPKEFGTGCVSGIVAPEASNNATAGGALITMMALGIPGDIITAVMLGALLIHDVTPSPLFIAEQPVLAYSIFLAFFLANFVTVALQSVTLRGFVLVTHMRMHILAAVILAYCAIGVFALNNVGFDLWTLLLFGILGFVLKSLGFPIIPIILGVVLGRLAEDSLSRVVAIDYNPLVFLERPWSLFFILLALMSTLFPLYQKYRDTQRWCGFFVPFFMAALSIPVFRMEGTVRPVLAGLLLVGGLALAFMRYRRMAGADAAAR